MFLLEMILINLIMKGVCRESCVKKASLGSSHAIPGWQQGIMKPGPPYKVFNRPGVAGAVLQTPSLLID